MSRSLLALSILREKRQCGNAAMRQCGNRHVITADKLSTISVGQRPFGRVALVCFFTNELRRGAARGAPPPLLDPVVVFLVRGLLRLFERSE
jgi:hypothetical protein